MTARRGRPRPGPPGGLSPCPGRCWPTGEPVTSADFAADERAAATARAAMSHIGPAVIVPARRAGQPARRAHHRPPPRRQPRSRRRRRPSRPRFAAQAGVALELADSRAEAERLSVYEDRDRIARDLHDLVIQRLYATGMSLQGTMPMIGRPEVADRVTRAVDAMDETIKEIRGAIFALQARDAAAPRDPRADIVRLGRGDDGRCSASPRRCGSAPGCARCASEELAEQALIVLREALSNVARHARRHPGRRDGGRRRRRDPHRRR